MKPRIYAIGFNNQKRIDTIFKSIPDKYERVILDNGSVALKARPGIELIVTGPGLFTEAFNAGIRDAIEHNAIPILLNDDLVIEKNCIEAMVKSIEDGAGIVAPMQVKMCNPDSVIFAGTGQAFPGGVHRIGRRSDEALLVKHNYKWLTFAAVALNPQMIQEIGLLDPAMRMYFSDSDYCARAVRRGWRCEYNPAGVVRHANHAATTEKGEAWQKLHFIRDRNIFREKWGGEVLRNYSRA